MKILSDLAVIANRQVISPACLEIENGKITKISQSVPLRFSSSDLDWRDAVLLPGFVNAHCHLELTGLGPLPQTDFITWIQNLMSKKRLQSALQIEQGIKQGMQRLMASGVTTIIDHLSFNTPLAAYDDAPLRIIPFGEVLGVHPDAARNTYEQLKNSQQIMPALHITPHSIHAVNPDILKELFLKELKPFSLHLSESPEERDYFHNQSGAFRDLLAALRSQTSHETFHHAPTGLQYIANQGWDLNQSLLVHGNYLTDADRLILKKWKNLAVVHCPHSHAFFNYQAFPYHNLQQEQISVALGTDSIASNNGLNFLAEIQCFLKKYPSNDLTAFLPLVTTSACQALGYSDIGLIQEGFHADLAGFCSNGQQDILEILKSRLQVDFLMSQGKILIAPDGTTHCC